MLYVGILQEGYVEKMYVSSVSADDQEDKFSANAMFIPYSSQPARKGDPIAQRAELQRLTNILTDGGAIVTIES